MKYLLALGLFAFSISGLAKTPDLICTTKASDPAVRQFTLSGIDAERPSVSIGDAPFQDKDQTRGLLDVSFSSECDSAYRLIFDQPSVNELTSGKSQSISGLFIYDNPDLAQLKNGNLEPVSESVQVDCVVKN